MANMGHDARTGLSTLAVGAPGALDTAGVLYFLSVDKEGEVRKVLFVCLVVVGYIYIYRVCGFSIVCLVIHGRTDVRPPLTPTTHHQQRYTDRVVHLPDPRGRGAPEGGRPRPVLGAQHGARLGGGEHWGPRRWVRVDLGLVFGCGYGPRCVCVCVCRRRLLLSHQSIDQPTHPQTNVHHTIIDCMAGDGNPDIAVGGLGFPDGSSKVRDRRVCMRPCFILVRAY